MVNAGVGLTIVTLMTVVDTLPIPPPGFTTVRDAFAEKFAPPE
jgi:hypothetical protein